MRVHVHPTENSKKFSTMSCMVPNYLYIFALLCYMYNNVFCY